jgi:chromosome partitioning protein
MPIITLSNQKGGCGKTTESVNLAAGLALMEYTYNPHNPARVLLVDGDPQAQSSNIISGGILLCPQRR